MLVNEIILYYDARSKNHQMIKNYLCNDDDDDDYDNNSDYNKKTFLKMFVI
jgi:hypothetical protein